MKYNILKVIFYVFGAVTLSFGIALAILSELGAGAYDALNYNLSLFLKISLGKAMIITVIIIFTITMILKPRLKYFLGFLLAIFVSFMVDLFSKNLPTVSSSFYLQCLYFILALFGIAFGAALIIRSTLPMNAMDNLMMILVEKTKKPVALIKTILESSYAVIALILGFTSGNSFGAISFGTLVMTFSLGPLINLFLKIIKEIK
ncbi:MAG: DUF6198 family protein [Bacilli bacterium]|nr:DUF6198 family protein [Bacilli bacterium]